MKKLFVIYKSHLDAGFTDFSKTVVDTYLTKYIPTAIHNAVLLNRDGKKRFAWLTGSWILNEYLNSVSGDALAEAEYAIRQNYISWHAMPFSVHSELLTAELLEYGLGISQKLDKKYGKHTVAAKQTDVPGVTKAMIRPLAEAGVTLMHFGVNPASAMPETPPIFRWRNDSGEELIVIYNEDYGVFTPISDECALMFCFAGDNHAPMSAEQIAVRFAEIEANFPDYEVVAGNLNDIAREAERVRGSYPVVDGEIGDSWNHGLATDPRKTFQYHALLNYANSCDLQTREDIYQSLLMVPEHTWGLDEKTHLGDHENFKKSEFMALLETEKWKRFASSWEEQRGYVHAVLGENNRALADEYKRSRVELPPSGEPLPYDLQINSHGEIVFLKVGDRILADESHPLCSFWYEQFSKADYDRFFRQYTRYEKSGRQPPRWALEDFTKIGMERGVSDYQSYRPILQKVSYDGAGVAVDLEMPAEAWELYGSPRCLQYTLTFGENKLYIDFAWFEKDPNRVAEAMWLIFSPIVESAANWRIEKLGQMIDPFHRVGRGGVQAYTSGAVTNGDLAFRLGDGGLVTFGRPNLLNYDMDRLNGECVSINLYNNIWGTNFPMWYGEDGRVRVTLQWG